MAVLKWEDMDQEAREYFEQAALDSLNLKQVVPQTPTAQGRVQPVPSTSSTTTFEASLSDQGISPWRAFMEERLPVLKQYFLQLSQPIPDMQGLTAILQQEWESMDWKQKAVYESRAKGWQYVRGPSLPRLSGYILYEMGLLKLTVLNGRKYTQGQEGIVRNQWRRGGTLQQGN